MRYYDCFGLSIASELPLPIPDRGAPAGSGAVPGADGGAPTIDLEIQAHPASSASTRCATQADSRSDPFAPFRERDFERNAIDAGGALYLATAEGVLVRVPGCADFLATRGRIEARGAPGMPDAELGDLAARIVLGFALQLRGMLALHGAAASRGGGALVIVGDRGAGKSTASLGLSSRGFGMLSDDIAAIDASLSVLRGLLRSRLEADSLERLSRLLPLGETRRDSDGKHAVDGPLIGEAAPLRLIVALEARDSDRVESRELRGYAKLKALLGHVHAPEGIGSMPARFAASAAALASVPLHLVSRPRGAFALEELVGAIDALFSKARDGRA